MSACLAQPTCASWQQHAHAHIHTHTHTHSCISCKTERLCATALSAAARHDRMHTHIHACVCVCVLVTQHHVAQVRTRRQGNTHTHDGPWMRMLMCTHVPHSSRLSATCALYISSLHHISPSLSFSACLTMTRYTQVCIAATHSTNTSSKLTTTHIMHSTDNTPYPSRGRDMCTSDSHRSSLCIAVS